MSENVPVVYPSIFNIMDTSLKTSEKTEKRPNHQFDAGHELPLGLKREIHKLRMEDYAKKHFTKQHARVWLFRRRLVPPERMICWQSVPVIQSLLPCQLDR
jgi:hypothetical protein